MKKTILKTSIIIFIIITTQLIICIGHSNAVETDGNKEVSDETSGPPPVIFFENPNFDFGKIYTGEKVDHIFKFENRGKSVLKVNKVKTSCGCTAAILTNDSVPPGKTGEIKANFRSGNYRGKVTKSVTVFSNDPNSPITKLTISGEIIQEIFADPRNIDFGPVYLGQNQEKTVTVKSQTGASFKIEKTTSSNKFVNSSLTKDNNGEYALKVTLNEGLKMGRFSGSIQLKTDNKKQPKIKIPFFGEIIGDITTYPKRIYYGTVKKGEELTQKIFVKINNNNAKILSTKISPDFLSTKTIERLEENNPHYLIEVTLTKDADIGKLDGILELHTNSKLQPVMKIPIIGEIN